jgi:hypothetical protein
LAGFFFARKKGFIAQRREAAKGLFLCASAPLRAKKNMFMQSLPTYFRQAGFA